MRIEQDICDGDLIVWSTASSILFHLVVDFSNENLFSEKRPICLVTDSKGDQKYILPCVFSMTTLSPTKKRISVNEEK